MARWLPLLALSLAACTANPSADPPTPADVPAPLGPPTPPAEAPATPPAEAPATPPTPPTPPAVPTAPADAAPGEPLTSWWCTCYSRILPVGGEPMTACRQQQKQCKSLERAVASGNRGLVPRSLTHACEEVRAAHPGDVYGGRDAWKPSKKPGSWLSMGACRLPGEGEPLQQGEADFNPMMEENIGGVHIGMTAADAVALLGEPTRKGRAFMEEASGTYMQDWTYADRGLMLTMESDRRGGPQALSRFTVKPPATVTTGKGVTIGSPRKAVIDAYGKMRDPFDPTGDAEDVFVAGSVYGGVFFTFNNDKVSEIFVGAGAE